MDLSRFLDHIAELAPGYGYDEHTRLDAMSTYQRLATTRWLADQLAGPVDHDILRQLATLGDAWRWLDGALRSGEPEAEPPRGRPGESTRVRLRALLDHDLLPLYLASFDPATAAAWRYRGRTLPVDEFVASLGDGVRVQYVVELLDTEQAVGLVSAYDHHQSGLHCKVAFLRFGNRVAGSGGAVFEGMMLFITHLFSTFPYRKVYAEVPAYNMALFEPGFAQEEGVLRDYLFHGGAPVDLHIVSFRRDQWEPVHAASGW